MNPIYATGRLYIGHRQVWAAEDADALGAGGEVAEC